MLSAGAEKWVKLNDIEYPYNVSGLVACDGCVHAIGSSGGTKFYVGLPSERISETNLYSVQSCYDYISSAAVCRLGNNIYLLGGITDEEEASNLCVKYHILDEKWSHVQEMVKPRAYCSVVKYDLRDHEFRDKEKDFWVIGGTDMKGKVYDCIEQLDECNNSFVPIDPNCVKLLTPRCQHILF